jgi:N-acetylglucosamine-6-phosphate deacetylase
VLDDVEWGEPARGAGAITGFLVASGEPARIRYANGTITSIEGVASAPPLWLSPGFVDLQVNGFAGHDFNAGESRPDEVAAAVRALWAHGVTTICPTIGTESEGHILRCLATIADARDRDPLVAHAIPAIHVEGPHISPEDGPRGAHPLAHVRPPDIAEYRRWQAAARGLVGIVTLAPEHPGAIDYVRALTDDGVVVAIGHTAADETTIRAAVEAGARLSTHLGNGAHATIRRHPNYIWDQLTEDRLYASVVLDGRHLPRAVIRAFLRAKGIERMIAVSDVVAFAGMPPGEYDAFGTKLELREDGALVVAGTPYFAGSTSPLDVAVGVAVRDGGLSVADAVSLVTANPAALLVSRLGPRRGSIAVGAPADLVGFRLDRTDSRVIVERTVVEGRDVFCREPQLAAEGSR